MRETDRHFELAVLELGAITDAAEVERALEPVGHALDHIGHERAGEALELEASLTGFLRGRDRHLAVLLRDDDLGRKVRLSSPRLPLTVTSCPLMGHGDALRQRDGHLPVTGLLLDFLRHHHTSQRTSPPMRASRAARSVRTPLDVERMATPRPFLTLRISSWPTRRDGRGGWCAGSCERSATVRRVTKRDRERRGMLLAHLVIGDVTLLLEDLGDVALQLGQRHLRPLEAGHTGVTDAREHVCDGIGHHGGVSPTSVFLLPARLGDAGELAREG